MSLSLEFSAGGWAWSLSGVLACAFAMHARRSLAPRRLLWLRGAAALCAALAALKPTLAFLESRQVKPKLLMLVDAGHSMGQRAGTETRLAAARRWIDRNRSAIESRTDPVVFALSDRGRSLRGLSELKGLEPGAAGFHPSRSLRDAVEGGGGEAVRAWLFSDGNAEAEDAAGGGLAGFGIPIDVVGVGPARRGRGLAFADLKTPDFAFLHGVFPVEAAVEASALSGATLTVSLLKESPGGRGIWEPLAKARVPIRGDYETVKASFSATAQGLGLERYRLEAACGSTRATREFRVEVIRQKYRIMYLSGRPSYEYSNLREFMKADPNHELVSFVILRNPDNLSFVPDNELSLIPFPAEEIFATSLSQFDLFILENFSYRRFNLPPAYLASLKAFVAAGGALLVIGGENAFGLGGYKGTPLEELLPVSLSDQAPDFVPGVFKAAPVSPEHPLVKLYESAEDSRAAWDALPSMDGYARFSAVKPQSTVLAVHPSEKTSAGQPLPVLALREYGRGKVMLVSSDSTWRWRLGAAKDWRAAAFYSRFWGRAVQYLTGSLDLSKVKFAPLPDRMPAREPAVLTLRVFDESFRPAPLAMTELSVLWTDPSGASRLLAPREREAGVYALELTGLAPGPHRLKASARYRGKPWGEDAARFTWEGLGQESPMDRRWLSGAAEAASGVFTELAAAEASVLLDRLPAPQEASAVRRRAHPWASPLWLWAAMLLLGAEWALRRRLGLP